MVLAFTSLVLDKTFVSFVQISCTSCWPLFIKRIYPTQKRNGGQALSWSSLWSLMLVFDVYSDKQDSHPDRLSVSAHSLSMFAAWVWNIFFNYVYHIRFLLLKETIRDTFYIRNQEVVQGIGIVLLHSSIKMLLNLFTIWLTSHAIMRLGSSSTLTWNLGLE